MRKSIKKIAASILAATMVLGSMTFASADEKVQYTEADCADGKVYYTLAGGVNDWDPKNVANQMTETIWEGVYSKNINLPAYDEAAEWNSRFKICKIDDVTVLGDGWTGSICLGTTVADDNQTMFRVESTTEAVADATVYFDANTGAVVILKDGAAIDYKFSWVGYEAEAGYTDVEGFATCENQWPAEKLKVDTTPDIKAGYDALLAKVTGQDLADESLYADGAVKYVVAGGCSPYAWGTTSSANEMKESAIFDGVYEFTMNVPAFDEAAEWNNRFKICRLDDITCANGWLGSLCLGTQTYDDNQTTFRLENAEAMTATVIFDSNTGAVYVKDSNGNAVDYKFSWVGYDSEVQYTTVSGFATCGYTWPEDKVKTDAPADLVAAQEALISKVNGTDLADESLYADGAVKYVVAGGCSPMAWGTTSSVNEMKESDIKGVYTFKMNVPKFDEAAEWNNRFKICRLDDITCANGWLGSLCVGTQTYDDNQTTFRLEIAEATEVTVYFQPETGAVVILDANGKEVDYKFSWVGYDNEVQYTTVSGFATCGYTWPEDKVKTDAPTDLADKYAALVKLIKEGPDKKDPKPIDPKPIDPKPIDPKPVPPTGDVAPVTLLFLLVAAVAVVTVVAKKKEA